MRENVNGNKTQSRILCLLFNLIADFVSDYSLAADSTPWRDDGVDLTSQHVWARTVRAQCGLLTFGINHLADLWFRSLYHWRRTFPTSAFVLRARCVPAAARATSSPPALLLLVQSRAVARAILPWSVPTVGSPRVCSRMARAVPTVPMVAAAGIARRCPSARCPAPRQGWGGSFRRDGRCLYPEWWLYSRPQVTPRNRAMPCPARTLRRTSSESRPPRPRASPWASRSAPRWAHRSRR